MMITISVAALALCIAVILVGCVPLTGKLQQSWFDLFLSFGAGVLLAAAFLHMLPTAIENLGPLSAVFVLLGFLLMTFLEHFTMAHPCGEQACPNHRIGITAFLGLSVHSIIAGLALGVGLLQAPDISVSIALMAAILVHKIPETLALMGLIAASKWSKQRSFVFLLLFALMSPLGIFLGVWLSHPSPQFLGAALAVSAGTFLYIASSDLLPHLHKKMKQQWIHFFAFLLGLLVLSGEIWERILS